MTDQGVDLPILDAKGISKSFGAVAALRDASLRIDKGEIVALMGANGAGKSTFVKILTGALRPDAGRVQIRGRDTIVASPAQARKSGLIPVYQEPSLIPDLDVADNLRLTDTDAEAFRHWVAELGIPDLRLDDKIGDLPLATLRILDLARALAGRPDVLLLDEMTAALPTNLVDQVLDVVRQQAAGRAGRHLYLPPADRDHRAVSPRLGPARRHDGWRPAGRGRRRGPDRRVDAGREAGARQGRPGAPRAKMPPPGFRACGCARWARAES